MVGVRVGVVRALRERVAGGELGKYRGVGTGWEAVVSGSMVL